MDGSPGSRISDTDRDRAVAQLREHCAAGRLTLDEFSERVGMALEARTKGELEPILADLPRSASSLLPETRKSPRKRIVAFMGGADAKGRWRLSGRITAIAVMGGCTLDLRSAELEGSEVLIKAFAFWGGVDIVLPEGIAVEVSGLSIMGGRSVRMKDVPVVPGSPLVRIRAYPVMAGISVRSRPSLGSGREGRKRGPKSSRDRSSRHAPETSHISGTPARVSAPESPEGPRPEVRGAPEAAADGTVTILFSDISDFSGLTERLGDRAVQELLLEHRDVVRKCVAGRGGREVKTHGDGFMLAFAGVARALRCAADIQNAVSREGSQDKAIALHMGIHTGEAITDGDDYIGHTVIVARRLADSSGPGEVLVSSVAHSLVARNEEFCFGPAREVSLKGLSETEVAAPFIWDGIL